MTENAPKKPENTGSFLQQNADMLGLLLIALVLSIASFAALKGSYVYDDMRMSGHPMMHQTSDVLAVFRRTSSDYMHPGTGRGPGTSGAFTYRPLTSLTLVAAEVATHSARVHHTVSLWLQIATVMLAFAAIRKLGAGRVVALAAVATFALAPALGEAWLWISGRADLLAGTFVAAFALALATLRVDGVTVPRVIGVLLCAAGAILSKETAVIALTGASLIVATTRVDAKASRRATALTGLGAVLVSVGLFVGLAVYASARVEGQAGALPHLDYVALLRRVPRIVTLGFGSLVAPAARPMRLLAYELSTRHGKLDMIGAVGFVVPLLIAIVRRSVAGVVAMLTAVAVLAPIGYVASTFWLGFDRYLYLGALGILLAIPDLTAGVPESRLTKLVMVVWAAHLVVSIVQLHGTAKVYQSPETFARSMMRARPHDPTGWYMLAVSKGMDGNVDAYVAALDQAPEAPDVIPLELMRIDMLFNVSAAREAFRRADALITRHPNELRAYPMAVNLRILQSRFDDAFALAERSRRDHDVCEQVRAALIEVQYFRGVNPQLKARAQAFTARPCR